MRSAFRRSASGSSHFLKQNSANAACAGRTATAAAAMAERRVTVCGEGRRSPTLAATMQAMAMRRIVTLGDRSVDTRGVTEERTWKVLHDTMYHARITRRGARGSRGDEERVALFASMWQRSTEAGHTSFYRDRTSDSVSAALTHTFYRHPCAPTSTRTPARPRG